MKRITTAREQFDMLSPWMITAAPPAFDKVYDEEGKFLHHQRPDNFPSLQPTQEFEELAEPPTQAPRVRQPVQLKMFPNSDFKKTKPEPQGLPEGWSEEKANGQRVVVSPNGNEYGPTPKTPTGTQGIIPKKNLSHEDQGLSSNLARFLIPSDMERSIIEKYNAADEATKAAGSQWYDTANEYIHNLAQKTGRDPRQVAAIVSAFSPQTSWDQNMAAANYFLMNYDPQNPNAIDDKMGGLGDNLERAKRIHAAGDEEGYLAGLQNGNDAHKITNFYHNMMGDKDKVTIDSWMARALMGQGQDVADKDVQKILGWQGGYDAMAGAVQSAAKKLGISPRELQAIVWSHVVPTAGGYEELTPEQYAKQKKQRENYVNNAPENAKLLPDYFHGPGWEARPEPTYPMRDLVDPQKLYAARRFWAVQDWNAVEDHIRGQQYPGVTLRNELGDAPTSGYMVSLPGHEEVRPYDAQAAQATDKDDVWTSKTPMSAETLEDFHNKKLPAIMQDKNNYHGGWLDDGDWFDDVSRNYQDIYDAAKQAYGETPEEAQHGFYDIKNGISPSPLEFIYKGEPAFFMARRLWKG